MSTPIDDIKAMYEYHKKYSYAPNVMIVSPELKERAKTIVKKLELPVIVVTPEEYSKL